MSTKKDKYYMTVNTYITNVDTIQASEQDLIDDLTIEIIQMAGHDFSYIPRTIVSEDEIFGEDSSSTFDSYETIEMYIDSVDGFEGEGDILSSFGLQISDTAKLVVSKTRFEEIYSGNPDIERPREGDLIYFPLTKGLFEINFVEDENPFYQASKLYSYVLTVELFDYSHEDLNTGITEVDDLNDEFLNNDDSVNDPYADNTIFDTEGDLISDFTENDPFGDHLD